MVQMVQKDLSVQLDQDLLHLLSLLVDHEFQIDL